MEKDKLKEFISENKSAFETDLPSQEVWKKIEQGVQDKPTSFSQRNLAQIISIAAVLVLGLLIFNPNNEEDTETIAQEEVIGSNEITIASISNEMAEVESFYIQEVNTKLNLLEQYEVDEDLMLELDILKEEYDALKSEMKHSVNPLEVIEVMIENYRLRLEILEGILQEFEEENKRAASHKTREHEMG